MALAHSTGDHQVATCYKRSEPVASPKACYKRCRSPFDALRTSGSQIPLMVSLSNQERPTLVSQQALKLAPAEIVPYPMPLRVRERWVV